MRDELGYAFRCWNETGVGMYLVCAEVAAGFRSASDYANRDSYLVWSTSPVGT